MSSEEVPAAIAILLAEHEAGHRYLDPLHGLGAASGEPGPEEAARWLEVAAEALAYLDTALEEHIAKEEEPLFPLLKARLPDDDRLIDEMIAEHDYVRIHRDDLRSVLEDLLGGHRELEEQRDALRAAVRAAAGSPDAAALEALRKAARRVAETALVHFENEEELVFPLAPQLLTPGELEEAAAAMHAIAARFAAARG